MNHAFFLTTYIGSDTLTIWQHGAASKENGNGKREDHYLDEHQGRE